MAEDLHPHTGADGAEQWSLHGDGTQPWRRCNSSPAGFGLPKGQLAPEQRVLYSITHKCYPRWRERSFSKNKQQTWKQKLNRRLAWTLKANASFPSPAALAKQWLWETREKVKNLLILNNSTFTDLLHTQRILVCPSPSSPNNILPSFYTFVRNKKPTLMYYY